MRKAEVVVVVEKTCCVTGHRKITVEMIDAVKREIRREVLQAIHDGYLNFISGLSPGVDLWFAEMVLELKRDNPSLTLEAVVPYRKRLRLLFENSKTRELLLQCSTIGVVSEEYRRDCFLSSNRFMVFHSSRVIAVYDGRRKGYTAFMIREATVLKRDVRVIRG